MEGTCGRSIFGLLLGATFVRTSVCNEYQSRHLSVFFIYNNGY